MGRPTTSPIGSSSSTFSHSPSDGEASSTDTDVSSSSVLETSGDDSDFNPSRVNFGPQKTPERRFLQKVRRKDSREFHRRQTIHWGLEGEGRDRVERKEGDEEREQQGAVEILEQEDGPRIESGNEEEEEEEDPSTPESPSRRPSSIHLSTRTTPAPPAYRALPSLLQPNNPPSSPAYDGDADSERDEDEASYMDCTSTLKDQVERGVDDSFDEVVEQEQQEEEEEEEEGDVVEDVASEPEPSSLSQQPLPLDELRLRLASPLPSPSHLAIAIAIAPFLSTLSSPPSSEVALQPEDDLEDATFVEEATFVDEPQEEDSDWEDELSSRAQEEAAVLHFHAELTNEGEAAVAEEVLQEGVESRMEEEEEEIVVEAEEEEQPELVVSIQEDSIVVELEGLEEVDTQDASSPEVAVVASLEEGEAKDEPSTELEREVVEVVEEPELVKEAPLEEKAAVSPSLDAPEEFVVEEEGALELESAEEILVDAASSLPPASEQLITFDVSPEKEASLEPELASPSTSVPLLTPSKPVISFLDSPPTPFHSLPILLPTPTPIVNSSQPEPQADVHLQDLPSDSTLVVAQEIVVAAVLDSEAEVLDASIASSVAPEVSNSPSKSETTDEDVELGRCGPGGRRSIPLVVQILSSPSELSPPPSSGSDSSTSISLAPLGTPTPASATPRSISTQVAPPTPLRPTESQSSASSSTSATPPTHVRKVAPVGPAEKRPASKVLKRASPQKAAAAAEKEADRVARLRFRAQLDAAVSRTSAPSPMRSASKPPPRQLDASTRTLGPSPRVGFVRTLARVTPSPTSTSTTSARVVSSHGRALGAPSSSAAARVITPQPLHRSKAAPPPSSSTARPALRATASAPAPSSSAPPPPSSSRPVFGSRAAPPQPSSALKARPAAPTSALKAPVSQLPKPSSGIPKPASMLPKGPSARVHASSSIGMSASSRAPVSSSARPKQALKTFTSWSSTGGPTSSVRRAGGDSSMSMPVSVGGGAFARGLESESSFRMDSSFRMESPRPSRPNLGEPVRVVSPVKGANGRAVPSSMSAGPIRMNSPIKSSSSSFVSSLGPSSHFNRARDGPFGSSSNSTSLFAQSASSSSFSENIKSSSAPSPRKGQSFLASVEASVSKAPTSLRDGKSLPTSEPSSSSSSKEPSPVNETRASSASSASNEQTSTALPPPPPATAAAAAPSVSSPLSEIPSSPTKSNTTSSSNLTAPTPPPPPPPITRTASSTTDASTTPGRSLRARREPEPQPPAPVTSSSSRPAPPPRTASSRAKKTNGSDPPPPEEMSVAQLKSFTLMNTTKNQVYFSAMEKVVVRKDGEMRPSSPGEKVKKAGKEWEATAAGGKKRKKPLFDAGEEFSSSEEEEEEEERKTHVRGPGEEEDFFSPVKQSTAGGKSGRGGGGKRSRGGGAGIEEATTTAGGRGEASGSRSSRKGVKWDKGLVWIRARKNQPLELEVEGGEEQEEQVGSTRGRKPKKGCMKTLDRPLDHMGNLPSSLPPLTEILKRDKVTYTQLVYDDDVQAAAPVKKGKK